MLFEEEIKNELRVLKEKNLYRVLRKVEFLSPVRIKIEGKELISFCSNNYLGLTHHPEVISAGITALKLWGTGGEASRLISGNHILYKNLEKKLAEFKETETALVFPTGYSTNIGVISALAGVFSSVSKKGKAGIFCDKLAHASIIDACLLSRANFFRFKHNDPEDLRSLLKKHTDLFPKIIITEGVFSMDGDIAPLKELLEIAEEFDALLFVDDAHATGVIGKNGKGSLSFFNLKWNPRIIQMGTLSKALASLGGFVCTSEILKKYFINKCRSLIFTTALPPGVLAVSLKALEILAKDESLVLKLQKNVNLIKKLLKEEGFEVHDYPTAIIPLIVGDAERALSLSEKLFEKGFLVPAVRPPAVPEGKARLRITVSSAHTEEEIEAFVKALKNC